jgi:DNA helicase-4
MTGIVRSGRDGGFPADPDEVIAQLAHALRFVTHELEATVRGISNGSRPATPLEASLVGHLRKALSPVEFLKLPELVAAARSTGTVQTATGRETRARIASVAAAQAAAESARKAERRKVEQIRAAAEERMEKEFRDEFLNAQHVYEQDLATVIPREVFEQRRTDFVRSWIKDRTGHQPDAAQGAAIGAGQGDLRVIARAGSGKTSVLVNRAVFLIEHCRVPGDSIMILAFNRNAANEVEQRIADLLGHGHPGRSLPYVATFHSLAYSVVLPMEDLVYDDADEPLPGKAWLTQSVMYDLERNPRIAELMRQALSDFFRNDWYADRTLGLTPQEGLQRWREQPQQSLRGDTVKSFGEKAIANFLFERGIDYRYEQPMRWNGRPYRPDFTLLAGERKIIIEYFGLKGDTQYDAMTSAKTTFLERRHIPLLSIDPGQVPNLAKVLKHALGPYMVVPEPMSDEELWNLCRDRWVSQFARSLSALIGRARQLGYSVEALESQVASQGLGTGPLGGYLDIAATVYAGYLERLHDQGKDDFSGLIHRAAAKIEEGQTQFDRRGRGGDLRQLNYLFIDEFQDFSAQFHRLTTAIRKQNPAISLATVGDDWQAINGFAGSDLRYFRDHADYAAARTVLLSTNYRSRAGVVHLGNTVMTGLGAPAVASRTEPSAVIALDISALEPTADEDAATNGDNDLVAVLRIAERELASGQRVHVLTRTNRSSDWIAKARSLLAVDDPDRLTASTVHKYKGRESETVVLLDADSRRFPLVHPYWVFNRVFGETMEDVLDAERRLLYVALTRARDHLYLIDDLSRPSPFLDALRSPTHQPEGWRRASWDQYPAVLRPEAGRVVVAGPGTYEVRDFLKASGFKWNPQGKYWHAFYPPSSGLAKQLRHEPWSDTGQGISVTIQGAGLTEQYWVAKGVWSRIDTTTAMPGRQP